MVAFNQLDAMTAHAAGNGSPQHRDSRVGEPRVIHSGWRWKLSVVLSFGLYVVLTASAVVISVSHGPNDQGELPRHVITIVDWLKDSSKTVLGVCVGLLGGRAIG